MTSHASFRTPVRIALLALLLFGATAQLSAQDRPNNIILMIGDGMGAAQLSLMKMTDHDGILHQFPVGGFSQTASADRLVTESAASATALSTGTRTRNGRIAIDPEGGVRESLIDHAMKKGKGTGVVATSSITHATPAAFLAHVLSRSMEVEIAAQIAASRVNVIAGGGRKFFLPVSEGGVRKDGRNLLREMAGEGAVVGYENVRSDQPAAARYVFLETMDALQPADRRTLSLRELVRRALQVLRVHENGFVLVVEGSQIDWACHDNDFDLLVEELRDFREAIDEVMAFAREDGATTVVVTSDHETGGLALLGQEPDASDIEGDWISGDHTASMVPLLAYGPWSERFGGIHRNDEIGRLLISLLGSD